MILLNSETLEPSLVAYLAQRQKVVNAESGFKARSSKAGKAWNGKSKTEFDTIRETLLRMTIGVEACNYCENNEAVDIEHIYPKSFYPGKTFKWENYLLACKKCNTHHKLDSFAIFFPASSTNKLDLIRGTRPKNQRAVMIDPRQENGMDFLHLDITGRTFLFVAKELDPTKRVFVKADFTLELLALNKRDALVAARRHQAENYVSDLQRYAKVKRSADFPALLANVNPLNAAEVDITKPFANVRRRILRNIKKKILEAPHTTVWEELKRQRADLVQTNAIFQSVPEALGW